MRSRIRPRSRSITVRGDHTNASSRSAPVGRTVPTALMPSSSARNSASNSPGFTVACGRRSRTRNRQRSPGATRGDGAARGWASACGASSSGALPPDVRAAAASTIGHANRNRTSDGQASARAGPERPAEFGRSGSARASGKPDAPGTFHAPGTLDDFDERELRGLRPAPASDVASAQSSAHSTNRVARVSTCGNCSTTPVTIRSRPSSDSGRRSSSP